MKIFYMCPDLIFPSGGIKRLYQHVQLLNENGFDAYILHFKNGFKPGWFQSSAPILYLDNTPPLEPGDTLVVPEGFPNVMKKFRDVSLNRIAIALNPLYILQSLPPGEDWRDYGFNTVLTSSQQIADLISWSMNINDIYVFKTSIDQDVFTFDPQKKRNQIAYVSRKDMNTPIVEKLLKLKLKDQSHPEFVKIENLNYEDYASVLQRSLIYITTSPYEGTNRSILEAMACGCLCAGYHGMGGRDYIVPSGKDQNFFMAETMNFFELSKLVEKIINDVTLHAPIINRIRSNAIKTAARFDKQHEKESILEFWSDYIGRKT